jgi:hypothetical protein
MFRVALECELQQCHRLCRLFGVIEQCGLCELHVECFGTLLVGKLVEQAERVFAIAFHQHQSRGAAAHHQARSGLDEPLVTFERQIRATFAFGDGRKIEERFGGGLRRLDQTTETAAGFRHVAGLVGELA